MYGSHPPPSDALIEASERELGVRLPPSYVALVRHRNGGHVRLNGVLLASPLPRHISDRRMYEFERIEGIQPGDFHSITEQTRLAREEWGVPDGLIAFDGDGHWWLCMDYRECGPAGEPPILHFDTESIDIREATGEHVDAEIPIADSFGDLLARLEYSSEHFVFAIDDKQLDVRALHSLLAGLGARRAGESGSAWRWTKYKECGYEDSRGAYLALEQNGEPGDPWHLARPAEHPLLRVGVAEGAQAACLRELRTTLGDRAELVHSPGDRAHSGGV